MASRLIGGLVGEWLRTEYNGLFRAIESVSPPIGNITEIVPADSDRVSLTLVNVGAGVCYVSTRQDIGGATGVRIRAAGGMMHINIRDDAVLPMLQWFGQTVGVSSSLYILQVKRDVIPDDE